MVRQAERKLFVEGGGNDNAALASECRRAFTKLLERAGLGKKPRIVVCGGRGQAYDQFCTAMEAIEPGDVILLLVDAEAPVTEASPWEHVRRRAGDNWSMPAGATDDHLHLMVQCMESWFLADRSAMRKFFGKGFRESSLPASTAKAEAVAKNDLYTSLEKATKDTTKGAYGKGPHSFKLLAEIDPKLISGASPWAKRFFDRLAQILK